MVRVRFCRALRSLVITVGVGSLLVAARESGAQPAVADPSCHQPFELKSKPPPFIAPRQTMDLSIDEDQWGELASLLQDFANKRHWSYRDSSRQIPGRLNSIDVSLCDGTLRILVVENHWLHTHVYDHPDRGLNVVLYGDPLPKAWQPIAKDLYRQLEEKWPDHVRFRGADGQLVGRPAYLD